MSDSERTQIFVCGFSRSGTTLMTTILDAHPAISMGYELLPGSLEDLSRVERSLKTAVEEGGDQPRKSGNHLIKQGNEALGKFVKRCGRTLVLPSELLKIISDMRKEGVEVKSLADQVRLCQRVVAHKSQQESTSWSGFKINTSNVAKVHSICPGGFFVYMLRDPRDVAASHFLRGFDRSLNEVILAWKVYLRRFTAFAKKHPGQAVILRYEDLVHQPEEVLARLTDQSGLPYDPQMLRFFESEKPSIHKFSHANARQLARNFFTSSVRRWAGTLKRAQVARIETACSKQMTEVGGYALTEKSSHAPRPSIEAPALGKVARYQRRLAWTRRKKLFPADYELMLSPFLGRYRPQSIREALVDKDAEGEPILMIRHDVDHDFETALRIARWEHDRFLRSTFCILHTAWYYGTFENGRYRHSKDLIEFCLELQDLGHEINLHNNFAVMALREGVDARALIGRELDALRSYGIEIIGTSTHGDGLCRDLGFYNLELFEGRAWPSKGGRRIVTSPQSGHSVELGSVSMADLGLEYEAYDLPRDYYVTDSGGRPRVRFDVRGLGGLRRGERADELDYPEIVGVLAHPIWWDFENDAPARRESKVSQIYEESQLVSRLRGEQPTPASGQRIEHPSGRGLKNIVWHPQYRTTMDQILYGMPRDLDVEAALGLLVSENERNRIGRIVERYLSKGRPGHRRKLYRRLMLARPNPEILLGYYRLNFKRLSRRYENVKRSSLLAWPCSYLNQALALAYERCWDPRLLEAVIESAEFMLRYRDDQTGRVDELRGRPVKSWGSEFHIEGKFTCNVTTAGRIAYPVLRACRAALSSLRHRRIYEARLEALVEAMAETISEFDEDYRVVPGTNEGYYLRRTHGDVEPLNHMASLGNALVLLAELRKNGAAIEMAKGLASFYKSSLWLDRNGEWTWCYQPLPDNRRPDVPERTWKATISSHFLLLAFQHGIIFDRQDIERTCSMFLKSVCRGEGVFNSRISAGLDRMDHYPERKGLFTSLLPWIQFGEYVPEMRETLEDLACIPELGCWFRHPMGSVAYAERIRRRTAPGIRLKERNHVA